MERAGAVSIIIYLQISEYQLENSKRIKLAHVRSINLVCGGRIS